MGKNNLTVDGARRIIEDTWKNGMLTLFHFKVDSLFQNLLRVLGRYKDRMGFEALLNELFAATGIGDGFNETSYWPRALCEILCTITASTVGENCQSIFRTCNLNS